MAHPAWGRAVTCCVGVLIGLSGSAATSLYPNCDVVFPGLVGDGYCDEAAGYNIEACGWDGGDCCTQSCQNQLFLCNDTDLWCLDPLYVTSAAGAAAAAGRQAGEADRRDMLHTIIGVCGVAVLLLCLCGACLHLTGPNRRWHARVAKKTGGTQDPLAGYPRRGSGRGGVSYDTGDERKSEGHTEGNRTGSVTATGSVDGDSVASRELDCRPFGMGPLLRSASNSSRRMFADPPGGEPPRRHPSFSRGSGCGQNLSRSCSYSADSGSQTRHRAGRSPAYEEEGSYSSDSDQPDQDLEVALTHGMRKSDDPPDADNLQLPQDAPTGRPWQSVGSALWWLRAGRRSNVAQQVWPRPTSSRHLADIELSSASHLEGGAPSH